MSYILATDTIPDLRLAPLPARAPSLSADPSQHPLAVGVASVQAQLSDALCYPEARLRATQLCAELRELTEEEISGGRVYEAPDCLTTGASDREEQLVREPIAAARELLAAYLPDCAARRQALADLYRAEERAVAALAAHGTGDGLTPRS